MAQVGISTGAQSVPLFGWVRNLHNQSRRPTMLRVTIAIFRPSSVSSTLYDEANCLPSLKSSRQPSKVLGCHGSTNTIARNFNCHSPMVRLFASTHTLLLRGTSPTTSAGLYITMDIGRIANGEPIGILHVGKRLEKYKGIQSLLGHPKLIMYTLEYVERVRGNLN